MGRKRKAKDLPYFSTLMNYISWARTFTVYHFVTSCGLLFYNHIPLWLSPSYNIESSELTAGSYYYSYNNGTSPLLLRKRLNQITSVFPLYWFFFLSFVFFFLFPSPSTSIIIHTFDARETENLSCQAKINWFTSQWVLGTVHNRDEYHTIFMLVVSISSLYTQKLRQTAFWDLRVNHNDFSSQ